jgi:ABC-type nitrate/sulfonate/bicarbonate transport system substrate-binding protein
MSRHSLLIGALATTVALSLAGCGQVANTIKAPTGTAQTLVLALPEQPNASYAGIYVAQGLGYFRQAGISLQIELPSGTGAVDRLPELVDGDFDVTLSSAPAVVQLQREGSPIVAVGALAQGQLWRTEPQYAKAKAAKTITTTTGTSSHGADAGTATSKRKVTGYKFATDDSLLPAAIRAAQGSPTYPGLVMVVREGTLQAESGVLRRFVQAVGRGYRQLHGDPTKYAQVAAVAMGAPKSAAALQAGVEHELPGLFPGDGEPWGWQDPNTIAALTDWLVKQHLVASSGPAQSAFTNRLLPGQGL